MSRGTTAIINFANLRHNFEILNARTNGMLVLVVKADAYGHGLHQVVRALDKAQCFGVATIDEALFVRKCRKEVKVLLLEGYLDKSELIMALENNLECVIHQQEQIDMLSELETDKKITVWLKLDSGMNRLGFNEEGYSRALKMLNQHRNVEKVILMSHYASADIIDSDFSELQKSRFGNFTDGANNVVSISNTSALLNENSLENEWNRVGIALFGVSPISGTLASEYNLRPVMTLKTNVIAIRSVNHGESIGYLQKFVASRPMKIAIIGIGYGDGYPWLLKESAYVIVNNQKARIVGRVSMDMMAVDITDIPETAIGDSVLIWGGGEKAMLPLEIVADNANTIPYVLLCQITSRVHYQYVNQ